MNDETAAESETELQPDPLSDSTDHQNTADPEQPSSENMLSAMEARIFGALMEKQLSTPDAYPLTVKSLLSACNQKSNREPVTAYQQGEVVRTLRQLESRKLVRYEMGARSERYEQRLTHELSLSKKQHALMCVMLLRGPQTASELQLRTQRLYDFQDRDDLQVSLERLTQGEKPMAVLIPRQSGQREDRYGHLLCGTPDMPMNGESSGDHAPASASKSNELEELRTEVALLRQQLDELYELTGQVKSNGTQSVD